jgi:protein-L-isoaspartate(D-aspartate) O-methyltransferase
MPNYAVAREMMVKGQILPNGVIDPAVVVALESVPREPFVPESARGFAYVDDALVVGPGRSLLEPLTLARMVQALAVSPRDTVLDVGCATGYSSAVLARLASAVVALESDAGLAAGASRTLSGLGIDNVTVQQGPLAEGWAARAPFNAILVNGAVGEAPGTLIAQLAEGGRLVVVLAPANPLSQVGQVRLYRRIAGSVACTDIFETGVSVLPGFEARPRFVF